MIKVSAEHFRAVMDDNKRLKGQNKVMAKALYDWLTYMDSQGYTDKQYKKGELRKSLQNEA